MRNAVVACAFVVVGLGVLDAGAGDKIGAEQELKKLQGVWTFESQEVGGQQLVLPPGGNLTITFDGDKFTVMVGLAVIQSGTQKLDPSTKPKTVDATVTEGQRKGIVMLGIYELDGDTFKVCIDPEGKTRPTEFKTKDGSQTFLNIHKRAKY